MPAMGFGGILHTVILSLASVLLLANLHEILPGLYKYALWSLLLLYGLGLVSFGLDVVAQRHYWANMTYTVAAPILIALYSVTLCAGARERTEEVRL